MPYCRAAISPIIGNVAPDDPDDAYVLPDLEEGKADADFRLGPANGPCYRL